MRVDVDVRATREVGVVSHGGETDWEKTRGGVLNDSYDSTSVQILNNFSSLLVYNCNGKF